jgi:hypothetical protein
MAPLLLPPLPLPPLRHSHLHQADKSSDDRREDMLMFDAPFLFFQVLLFNQSPCSRGTVQKLEV